MTRPATRRRLAAALGALLAVVLGIATTATPTAAAWADEAVVAAQATAGTWSSDSECEVLSTSTGEVIGSCSVDGVTFSDPWANGTRFSVAVSGFQPSNDRVARVRVDLSKYSSEWNWPAGILQMDSAQNVDWSAPVVTFTTYPWGFSPFTGTFTGPHVRAEARSQSNGAQDPTTETPAQAEPQQDAAQDPDVESPAQAEPQQEGQQDRGGASDSDEVQPQADEPAASATSPDVGAPVQHPARSAARRELVSLQQRQG